MYNFKAEWNSMNLYCIGLYILVVNYDSNFFKSTL